MIRECALRRLNPSDALAFRALSIANAQPPADVFGQITPGVKKVDEERGERERGMRGGRRRREKRGEVALTYELTIDAEAVRRHRAKDECYMNARTRARARALVGIRDCPARLVGSSALGKRGRKSITLSPLNCRNSVGYRAATGVSAPRRAADGRRGSGYTPRSLKGASVRANTLRAHEIHLLCCRSREPEAITNARG